ncbi:MAG: ATP-binding protein [Calditrichaceae bacterium]
MRKKRLLWQIFPSFLLILVVGLAAVTWYSSGLTRNFYFKQSSLDLESEALMLEPTIRSLLNLREKSALDSTVRELGKKTGTRITVILPNGKVIADSDEDPAIMDNHMDRPEIKQALAGNSGSSIRFSYTIDANLMYVAIPVKQDDQTIALVRTSKHLTSVESALIEIQKNIAISGLIIALITAFISLLVARRISAPVEEMTRGVEHFSKGNLEFRLPALKSLELSKLSDELNKMAAQLDEKIKTIITQNNEQQAVLQSMAEGVFAVDRNERVMSMNKGAAKILGIDPKDVRGRDIHELFRNTGLQNIVTGTLESDEMQEAEIILHNQGDFIVQVHGTALQNEKNETIGALIVLNDVTRLRRLENGRKDFVANASHEIRTPLTSIKGFVEALADGAIHEPEKADKFLEIISRQTNRLNSIIDDLLTLARLENDGEKEKIVFEVKKVSNVLEAAVQICEPAALTKNISIITDCPADLSARINDALIEEAMINLLDNAIKYSSVNGAVKITCRRDKDTLLIEVKDDGVGIAEEHLARIFERFYRVDKARSRKMGGTGLGLAITKHIVHLHKGNITVISRPGQGSTFSISLPI